MKQFFLSSKKQGYIIPNIAVLIMVFATKMLLSHHENGYGGTTLIYSEFVILPMLMGMLSAWFWRNERLNTADVVGRSAINGLITIGLSFLFLGEGVICLIIVSPLLWIFITIGTSIGKALFQYDDTRLNVSVFSVLLLLFFIDAGSKHHYQNMVTDTMMINAPIGKVWQNVVAFKRIKDENKYWLFKIGMPSPVESTVEGRYLGAKRKCIFSNGYTFDEKIITFDVNKNLTFAVTNQPRDPEIMGHIDIQQGQFLLHDNGDGTTTLTGNSWYQLHVFPVWYYDLWAESIIRNVHLRVMDHIKELSGGK